MHFIDLLRILPPLLFAAPLLIIFEIRVLCRRRRRWSKGIGAELLVVLCWTAALGTILVYRVATAIWPTAFGSCAGFL